MDNIYPNVIEQDVISCDLTATIFNHLPQFSIITDMFGKISSTKSNIYERDCGKFHEENFILDYFSVDWEDLSKIGKLNVHNLTQMYLNKSNMLLDT